MARLLVGFTLLLVTAGCATNQHAPAAAAAADDAALSGAVGFQDISGLMSAPTGRLKLGENETYLEALEDPRSPMPVYPADLLSARLPPQTACVRVSLNEQGKITSIIPAVEPPACPEGVASVFASAVSDAVERWAFEPARRCSFPTAAAKAMAFSNCSGGQETPIAVTLTYKFVFEQKEGEGSVRLGR